MKLESSDQIYCMCIIPFFEVALTTAFSGVKYRFVALEITRVDVSGVGMSKSGCKT